MADRKYRLRRDLLTCLTYLRDSKEIKFANTFNPSMCRITASACSLLCNLLCIITALSKAGFHCTAYLGRDECEYWQEDQREMKRNFFNAMSGVAQLK